MLNLSDYQLININAFNFGKVNHWINLVTNQIVDQVDDSLYFLLLYLLEIHYNKIYLSN